jgi:hypothetical protein
MSLIQFQLVFLRTYFCSIVEAEELEEIEQEYPKANLAIGCMKDEVL